MFFFLSDKSQGPGGNEGPGYGRDAEEHGADTRCLMVISGAVDINEGNSQTNPDIKRDCKNPVIPPGGCFPQEKKHSDESGTA